MGIFEDYFPTFEERFGFPLVVAATLIVGVILVLYFGSSSGPRRKLNSPSAAPLRLPAIKLGDVTSDVLQQYDGSDEAKPLLMAIKGTIYDVSRSRQFYGPGGPYEAFAGKDASRALAKMSFEPEDISDSDIAGLTFSEMETLNDWEMKFSMKYDVVGKVVKELPASTASEGAGESAAPTETGQDLKEE